jgi:hypothetical protein
LNKFTNGHPVPFRTGWPFFKQGYDSKAFI